MTRAVLAVVLVVLCAGVAWADVDTRSKRSSAINPVSPWRGLWPAPDGTLTEGDRRHTDGFYSGLAFSAPSTNRYSMLNPLSPWRSVLPIPDGTVGQGDRQVVSLLYAGILAQSPGGTVLPIFQHYYREMWER